MQRVLQARDRIGQRLPDVDPHDLLLILDMIYRPLGSGRRLFLREVRPGVYVF